MDRSYWYKITVKEKSDKVKKAVDSYFKWKNKMNYPSMYKGFNSIKNLNDFNEINEGEMKIKKVTVIDVDELNLSNDDNDNLNEHYEVLNDSYHRFYSDDDYMSKPLHEKIIKHLKDNHVITDEFLNNEYNYILLHFNW